MAKRFTIEILMDLAKSIGANPQKFMGTRTNISFLGKGPTKNPLFQNRLAGLENAGLRNLGDKEALISAVDDAMGFASAGKLNSIQTEILGHNLAGINKILNPPPLPLASVTPIKEGIKSINLDNMLKQNPNYRTLLKDKLKNPGKYPTREQSLNMTREEALKKFPIKKGDPITAENFGASQFGSRKLPFEGVEIPQKTYAARATMYRLLDMEAGQGGLTLREVMSPQDLKWLLEGGGGVKGDPIALFAKYFGNASARQIPTATAPGAIERFAREVIQRKDRLGRGINDPFFSPEDIPFAQGGLARILEV